jgi:hypothetical protein
MIEAFFDSVPDEFKLKLNGEVLHDTAILPDFIPRELADRAFNAALSMADAFSRQ